MNDVEESLEPALSADLQEALGRLHLVMIGTSDPANIGAACRLMKNFGVSQLVLVAPRTAEPQGGRARALACSAEDVLENAVFADSMEDAATRYNIDFLAGTSGRISHVRGPFLSPEEFAAEAWPHLLEGRRIGLVLGREDNGLSTEEIVRCRWKVRIPTSEALASLNVAQSAAVLLYCIRRHGFQQEPVIQPLRASSPAKQQAAVTPASPEELERLMDHLRVVLQAINFAWQSNTEKLVIPLRRLFQRAEITSREAGILTTFCRRTMYALGDRSLTRAARRERPPSKHSDDPTSSAS